MQKTPVSSLAVEDRCSSSPSSHTSISSSSSSASSCWIQEDLCRVFSLYDGNGDGKVSADELETMLRTMGNMMTTNPDDTGCDFKAEAAVLMELADLDGDGVINFQELAACVIPEASPAQDENFHYFSSEEEEDLKLAFSVYDRNGDGVITAEELHHVLQWVLPSTDGNVKTLADCRNMIRAVDRDGDGTVCFGEFVAMMRAAVTTC